MIDRVISIWRNYSPKMMTLGAYGYQATASLLLVFVVAHILPAAEYKRFSLAFATAQFAAIAAFEWVRIAATRFYPGPDEKLSPLQMASLGAAFAGASALGCIVALCALYFGAPILSVGIWATLALGQGFTDLHFTMMRFRGDLITFARMQSLRASLMLLGGAVGSWLGGGAVGTLLGLCLAYGVTILTATIADKSLRHAPWRSPSATQFVRYVSYGGAAAGASILYLGTLVIGRYVISVVAPGAASGVMLALDLFQRPFAVVTTAVHAILYPPVVAAYDRGGGGAAFAPLRRLYVIETACTIGLAVFLVGLFALRPLLSLVVPGALQASFASAATWAIVAFAARAILINIAPIRLHLMQRSDLILLTAVSDGATFMATLAIAYKYHLLTDVSVVVCLALTGMTSLLTTALISRLNVRPSRLRTH